MTGVDVFEYNGRDYQPTMHFRSWRVAFLNYGDSEEETKFHQMERHLLTDEVFVLLQGEATLIIDLDKKKLPMEKNKIYNIKQGVWHAIFMSEDAKVLIVEEHSTSTENSEYVEVH